MRDLALPIEDGANKPFALEIAAIFAVGGG